MGTAPEDSAKYVEQLRQWINGQPHLPKDLDDNLVLRFAHSCYYDLEKAKKAIESFFTIRGTFTDILTNRDPQSPHMQKIFNIINLAQCRSVSGKKMLWFSQINDPGLENYDYQLDVKQFFLTTDAYFLEESYLPEEDIVILDVKDITLRFLTKMNLSMQRKLTKYQEEGMPIRLKQVHVVNSPPAVDKIYSAVKPFMKKDLTDLIHFHPKAETLLKHFDKEDLPADFGGTRPALSETKHSVQSLIMRNRDKLISENLWKPAKNQPASTELGSFRTLAID